MRCHRNILPLHEHLETMRSMDDHILNAYILRVNPDKTATFLVDDLYPLDPQGSAKIGEVSTAPDQDRDLRRPLRPDRFEAARTPQNTVRS